MCPFKPLSELVLKCDTGINLSQSCCGGVEPPLMEIFGRVAISSQAPRGVMVESDSQTHGGFWDAGEDVWRVHRHAQTFPCMPVHFGHSYFNMIYCNLCLHWCYKKCPRSRNATSIVAALSNNISLIILANCISFVGQPSIKECAFNELTELIVCASVN